MNFLRNLFLKYNIYLLIKIFIYEIKYVIENRELPLFSLKQNKNKNFHLSISTPFYFLKKISEFPLSKSNSIFIDFGSGDGKVVRYLAKRDLFNYYFGYELKEKLVDISIKKNNFPNVHFEKKNLLNFNKNEKIFNFIKKEKIKYIYLYFYNPFEKKIVYQIIECFKNFSNVNIVLLGFENFHIKEFISEISLKLKLIYKKDNLNLFKNEK